MSIATMSARVHALTPPDELIGSLTKERVELAVRYAGAQSLEGTEEARHWLGYALGTDVPAVTFAGLAQAFENREQLEECDLEFWYDLAHTEANLAAMKAKADCNIDYCVRHLTAILCTQLGVTA
jgi:hypothetical protein